LPGFSGKNREVTPSVAAPGVTHPSDATAGIQGVYSSKNRSWRRTLDTKTAQKRMRNVNNASFSLRKVGDAISRVAPHYILQSGIRSFSALTLLVGSFDP